MVDPLPVNTGWSWTTTITAIQTVVVSTGFAALVWGMFKGIALLIQRGIESRKQDSDAASLVRREMMEFNAALQKRIEGLEQAGRDDRNRFDEELARTRRQHAEEVISVRNGYEAEIRGLRDEIGGLRKQMAQWQATSGAAQLLSGRAPTSAMKRADTAGIGELLRTAYDIPSGKDDANNG